MKKIIYFVGTAVAVMALGKQLHDYIYHDNNYRKWKYNYKNGKAIDGK